jgi:peptide/nickel transport system permease protein
MIPFLARRVLSAVPTLFGISLLTFLVLNLLPNDPVMVWSGGGYYSAEAIDHLRSELRLQQRPAARYLAWGTTLLRGDLGRSLRDGRPVTALIAEALPWSLLLNVCAIFVIYGLAVPFGLFGAAAPGSPPDRIGRALLIGLYGVPSFAAALLLQQGFAVRLGWLPLQGVPDPVARTAAPIFDLARHLVLPTTCLALGGWALVARYSRAAFRSALGREYMVVARAKGLSRPRAWRHVIANTAVPFVTLLATIVPGLVGGSVIVEQIFSLPGLGRLYLTSIEARDYPVVVGLTLMSAVLVLAGQLLADCLYLVVDPRIRSGLLDEHPDAA